MKDWAPWILLLALGLVAAWYFLIRDPRIVAPPVVTPKPLPSAGNSDLRAWADIATSASSIMGAISKAT